MPGTAAAAARMWPVAVDLRRVALDEGADGFHRSWIMLFPEGEYEHSQYGKLDFSRKTLSEIKDNFDHGAREIEIAIDRDHKASEDDSRAMGWIERLELREGMKTGEGETPAGLWALVRWTPLGLSDVRDQVYRYFSPEYKPEYVNQLTGRKYRNVLIGGALTNRPFLKAMRALQLADGGATISRRPWGEVDKAYLPDSAFLDPANRRLPVYEGTGPKDADGRYTRRGPLNINGVRAAIAALHGARSGKPMTGLPAGVAAKLQRWWDRYGGGDGSASDDGARANETGQPTRAARERMPGRRSGTRKGHRDVTKRGNLGTVDDERLLDDGGDELDDDEGAEAFAGDMPDDEEYDEADGDGPDSEGDGEDDGFDAESDTHGPMTVKGHSHGKYGRHAHSADGDHSEAPVKMSAKMSASARSGNRQASERLGERLGEPGVRQGREDGEVRRLREELAQVRFQLYEADVEKTIEGWGKQTFQFRESPKAAPKSGRIALSRAFREQYRAFMLGEAIRLSEGQRQKLNALIEGALSTAIVDLSSRGSSFDQESRRTRRGGEPAGGPAEADRLQQRAEQLAQEQGVALADMDPAKTLALYERAAREIRYGAH